MFATRLGFILLVIVAIAKSANAAHAAVSDEFVKSLKCDQLSIDSIYSSLAPAAYGRNRWIYTNNSTDMQVNVRGSLGDCWSLARWQRLALTLGRKSNSKLKYSTHVISNLIRNTQDDGRTALAAYHAFGFPMGAGDRIDLGEYIRDLQNDRSFKLARSYYKDLHFYQQSEFYRFSNLYYVTAIRTMSQNFAEMKTISHLAVTHRLPIVILRFNPFDQHVVLIKDVFKDGANSWKFEAIDPNFPEDEGNWHLVLKKTDSGITLVYGADYPNISDPHPQPKPVDVFLVGEDERPKIDRALLRYYQDLCR